MFGQSRDHPHGGPPRYNNGHFPGPPVGMTAGSPYQPPYARGRGGGRGGGGPVSFQTPPFSRLGSYQGFPPPNHGPPPLGPVHPPPPPPPPPSGSPPKEAPYPPPSFDEGGRSGPMCSPPPPPPTPKDAEMLKNIEVLASFVAKNGPRFENIAREKQADNPKLAFLFGGERGTEAAIGFKFYEWKKELLAWEERSKPPRAGQTRFPESNQLREELGAAQLSHEVPRSASGSDMDMEDDSAVTPPTSERKPAFDRGPVVSSPKRERRSGFSSPVELLSQASDRKIGLTSPGFERRSRFSSPPSDRKVGIASVAAERAPQGNLSRQVSEAKVGSSSSVPADEEQSQQGSDLWTSVQALSSDSQYLGVEGGKGSQGPDTSKAEKDGAVSELPRRRDSRRRTGFDRPCMEDVSPQNSPPNFGEPKEKHGESAASVELERKGVPPHGHPDVPTKISRWGPPESGPAHHGNRDLVSDQGPGTGETSSLTKGHKRSEASHHRGEESLTKDRSQSPKLSGKPARASDDSSARDTDKPKSRPVSDSLAVDEFGRLLRQGGSDSDGEGHHGGGKKRRRSMSRSRTRSRSPGDARRKRWSPSRSPRRRGRRSRSWSTSPRRQRSRSRTPPREGRWGGEGRGERGFPDRVGRRGGRGGGPQQACFDFAKGRCQRGAACRFLHEESNGLPDDQGGRWGGGRGRGRGRGRFGRDAAEDGDRNWGGKSGEQPRLRKGWNERNIDDDSRERKLIEELKKQEVETSSAEPWEQRKGDAAPIPGSTAAADQGSSENLALQSDKESTGPATAQLIKSSSEYMCEALSPSIPATQSNQVSQQTGGLPNTVSPPQQPNYHTTMAHQYNTSLSAHLPQHPSFSPSTSSQPQQPKYSLSHSQPQQNVFPSSQHSGYPQNVPSLPQKSGFVVNRPPQQPTFTPSPVSYSGNSPMPTQQPPPFATLPMLRPQPSFSAPQPQNFASPVSMAMSVPMSLPVPVPMSVPVPIGQAGLMSRTSVMNTPSQMLQVPMGPNLTTRLTYSWAPPGMVPPVSYGITPQQPLQQPPPPPPQPQTQSLSPQPPPQVSVPQPVPYQYAPPMRPTHAGAAYSTLASHVMAPSCISSNDQYDPLADSLEPGPPGAGDKKKGSASYNQNSQLVDGTRATGGEQWKLQSAGETTPIMTNAGEVVLENVSPGLPGHIDNSRANMLALENVSPRRPMHMVLENVSPTNVGSSFNVNTTSMNYGGTHQAVTMESVSPAPDRNPTGYGEKDPAHGSKDQKKKDKDSRILNLIRKAVAEHVKDLLKPTWKEGQMSKDAFKTIAKKAVDKVMGALEAKGTIPKSQEKLDLFMDTSKPKIAKLVQGYVDKYVKA